MHRVVEDFLDSVLDEMKNGLEDYASGLRYDLELYVSRVVRRVARVIIQSLVGAVLISAGLVFSVVGLATYLSQFMSAGLAWGVVGVGTIATGLVLLLPLLRGRSLVKR